MIVPASTTYGIFFECPPTRGRLACVIDSGPGVFHCLDILLRQRRNSRKMLKDVQRHPLSRQESACPTAYGCDDLTFSNPLAVPESVLPAGEGIKNPEHMRQDLQTCKDAPLPCDEASARPGCGRDNEVGCEIT